MQNSSMSRSITIRDVPDDVARELASRAARSGRSLQEYLRTHLIDLTYRPDVEVWVADVLRRTEATPSRVTRQAILESREAERR